MRSNSGRATARPSASRTGVRSRTSAIANRRSSLGFSCATSGTGRRPRPRAAAPAREVGEAPEAQALRHHRVQPRSTRPPPAPPLADRNVNRSTADIPRPGEARRRRSRCALTAAGSSACASAARRPAARSSADVACRHARCRGRRHELFRWGVRRVCGERPHDPVESSRSKKAITSRCLRPSLS